MTVAVMALAGCAVGRTGTLVARTTYTSTARIIDAWALGVWLRPQRDDAGATLGLRHTGAIFERRTGDPATGSHWQLLRIPATDQDAISRCVTSAGVELAATPWVRRVAIGWVDDVFTVVDPTEARVVRLHWSRSQPQHSRVEVDAP